MTPAPLRIAVVGGGITGLAAAHRLLELSRTEGRPVDISLYEASNRLGGVFGMERVDGYRLELGADMFITDKPWGLDLCRRLGLAEQIVSPDPAYRQSLILRRGKPVPTPLGFNLMLPGSARSILSTPLLSPAGKLRVLAERWVPRASDEVLSRDESIASFVRRRLGREALDRIVQPLTGGIYTGDPERLSIEATFPRFREMERKWGGLFAARQARTPSTAGGGGNPAAEDEAAEGVSGARYGLFVSLSMGMGALQSALERQVRRAGTAVRLSEEVRRIEASSSTGSRSYRVVAWRAGAGEGEGEASNDFSAVVVAVPTYAAAEMLAGSAPDLASELRSIDYASSAIVVTGHRLADVAHPLDAYGLVVPRVEGRKVLAVSFLSRKFPDAAPEGRVILRTFVGGTLQPELAALPDDELLSLVRRELADLLGVRGEPEVRRIARYPRTMPQYHVGHLDRVRRIEALAAAQPGLALCGNAYHGVGLPDCIHSGETAAERLWSELSHE